MKKYLVILAGIVGSMFNASCSSNDTDEIVDNNPKVMRFYVDAPVPSTRVVVSGLGSESPSVHWEEHDEINVWGIGHTGCNKFTFTSYSSGFHSTGVFEGTAFDASKYYLMYPYQENATFSEGVITATIPAVQTATLNSFDPKAVICTGTTESKTDESITLNHACSFFQITVPEGRQCTSITVKPYNGGASVTSWKMTGEVTITTNSTSSAITGFPAGESYVKLVPPPGSTYFGAGTYLLAFACSAKFPGIDVDVEYVGGASAKKQITEQRQFNSKTIYNLGIAIPNN